MSAILALDLGTTTGWALFNPPGATLSGIWDLKPRRFDGGGMRFVRMRKCLDELAVAVNIKHVCFEEVRRHAATDAAHVYGGLMATLTAWCEERHIPYEGVSVGSIKKSWTGNGAAKKDAMIAEARARGYEPADDNEADALALLDFKLKEMRG